MKITMKPFDQNDIAELTDMVFALYAEDLYGEKMTIGKINRTIAQLSFHPEFGKIVMFVCDKITVGYAIIIYYWSNEYGGNIVFIDELYVKPAWRKRGIAKKFIDSLHRDKRHPRAIQVEVTPSNLGAFEFYKKQDFQIHSNRGLVKIL